LALKKGHDGKSWYEPTLAAVRLANAKLIKRITRAKANLYVAELLQRADEINANPDLVYRASVVRR
jgi:hypothetical protein